MVSAKKYRFKSSFIGKNGNFELPEIFNEEQGYGYGAEGCGLKPKLIQFDNNSAFVNLEYENIKQVNFNNHIDVGPDEGAPENFFKGTLRRHEDAYAAASESQKNFQDE